MFDQIEQLEIPDDMSVTLSQTESLSLLPPYRPKDRNYPLLQEWLQGSRNIEFQFDEAEYKLSTQNDDEFSRAQYKYITKLYKVVESLAADNVTGIDETEFEPIGVVSAGTNLGANSEAVYKEARIDDGFLKILESFTEFVELTRDHVLDEDGAGYDDLVLLLECLRAAKFCQVESQRPELFAHWVNRYDPQPDNQFIEQVMYLAPKPYKHQNFWDKYLPKLIMRGMFEQAALSLRTSKFEELAESCPKLHSEIEDLVTVIGSYTGMAANGQFAEWKFTVCEFRDSLKSDLGLLSPEYVLIGSQIHRLLSIMSGLPKTTSEFASSWYELFGALALFQVRDDSSVYGDYFAMATAEKGLDVSLEVEKAFADILRGKYLKVVLSIDRYDPPTAAYVSRLLELKGCFQDYYSEVPENSPRLVSTYLLTRHAYECLHVHLLVPVGTGLLLYPIVEDSNARKVIAEFIPHYEAFTNDDLEWALTLCTKLNLTETVKLLYMKQGEKSLDEGHIYEALNMLASCYDDAPGSESSAQAMRRVHHISWDLLFQDCLLNSSAVPDELLENIIKNKVDPLFKVNPVVRQCISPYAVLSEYFESDGQDLGKDLLRLFHLLRFKHMPRKFVPLLLAQFLPVLEDSRIQLPDLIVMIELIDAFELKAVDEETEKLYSFAIDNVPETQKDWRNVTTGRGEKVPASLEELLLTLREKIMMRIARVYVD